MADDDNEHEGENGEGESEGEDEEATRAFRPTTTRVLAVPYCPVSGVPFEYIEFCAGPSFKECQESFKENYAEHYPEVEGEEALAELMQRLGLDGSGSGKKKKGGGGGGSGGGEGEGGAGGKKNKKPPAQVVIELTLRNKRKHITLVKGLEAFNVDLSAAAKAFGKKFASGSALQKGKNGLPDQIEIQGNCRDDLPPFIAQKLSVPLPSIFVVGEDGKKFCAADGPAED